MVDKVNKIVSKANAAIAKAESEVIEENINKGVGKLKVKLREMADAKAVVDNIRREIEEIKLQIEQGNI